MHHPTREVSPGERSGSAVAPPFHGGGVFETLRHRRTFRATPSRTLEAVARAVELLGYPRLEVTASASEMRFRALGRTVTVQVLDAEGGNSIAIVEFRTPGWRATGGSAVVILPGLLLGALARAQDHLFARRFLDNVQRVLQERALGWDPAGLPGIETLREKLGLVEE